MTTSGSGVIDVSGGTLNVGGTVTPEVFTNFTRTGGTVNLLGVPTNTGNTFTFNATTGTWNLAGGTVVGGTIAFADGQTLAISTSFNNRLTGVTITGDLVMNIAGAVLRISGGLTVNGGAIRLTGYATTLAYEGTQTWSTGGRVLRGFHGWPADHRGGQWRDDADAGFEFHRARQRRLGGQPSFRQHFHAAQQRHHQGGRVGPEPGHPQPSDADQRDGHGEVAVRPGRH